MSPEPGQRGHDWDQGGRMTLTSQSLRELSATAPHRGRAQLAAGSAGTEQVHVHYVSKGERMCVSVCLSVCVRARGARARLFLMQQLIHRTDRQHRGG